MSYQRVLPRDLFNEAKLLKCLGRLSLLTEDGFIELEFEHDTEDCPYAGFWIDQNQDDGSFHVVNLRVLTTAGREIQLFSPLNSRQNYPLEFLTLSGYTADVFDQAGNLSAEFIEDVATPARPENS